MSVLQTNNLTYAELSTICPEHQMKILSLASVFSHLPSLHLSGSLCHFLSFSRVLTETQTHCCKLSIQNAPTRDQTHARFPLSLLLTFYQLWPQSVHLSLRLSTCPLLLFPVLFFLPATLHPFCPSYLFSFSHSLYILCVCKPLFFSPYLE